MKLNLRYETSFYYDWGFFFVPFGFVLVKFLNMLCWWWFCLRVGSALQWYSSLPTSQNLQYLVPGKRESSGGLGMFKVLLLLQCHQLADTDSDFIWNFPGLDLLENEQFVLETATGVAFHLRFLAKHDFSAGSTQDTSWNVYITMSKSSKQNLITFSGICLYRCWQKTCGSNMILSASFKYFFL